MSYGELLAMLQKLTPSELQQPINVYLADTGDFMGEHSIVPHINTAQGEGAEMVLGQVYFEVKST